MCIILQLEILEVSFGKTGVTHGILETAIEIRKDIIKALCFPFLGLVKCRKEVDSYID